MSQLHPEWDYEILNPPFSDEYLKAIKVKEGDMSNLRSKLEKVIRNAMEYELDKSPSWNKDQEFINDKVYQIIEYIEQELAILFREVK